MPVPEASALIEKLTTFVDADPDDELVTDAATEAISLVANFVGTVNVPDDIGMRACLEVGADLVYRRRSRNGIVTAGGQGGEVAVTRIARDPMTAAYPLLTPFTGPGLA